MLQKKNYAEKVFLLVLCVQLLSCWRMIILSVVPACQADSRQRKWNFTGVKATDQLALSTASMGRGSPLRWVERHAVTFLKKIKSECIAVVWDDCEKGNVSFSEHITIEALPALAALYLSSLLCFCNVSSELCFAGVASSRIPWVKLQTAAFHVWEDLLATRRKVTSSSSKSFLSHDTYKQIAVVWEPLCWGCCLSSVLLPCTRMAPSLPVFSCSPLPCTNRTSA